MVVLPHSTSLCQDQVRSPFLKGSPQHDDHGDSEIKSGSLCWPLSFFSDKTIISCYLTHSDEMLGACILHVADAPPLAIVSVSDPTTIIHT